MFNYSLDYCRLRRDVPSLTGSKSKLLLLHSDQFGPFHVALFVQLFMQAQNLKLRLQIYLIIVSRIRPVFYSLAWKETGSAKYRDKDQMKHYSA